KENTRTHSLEQAIQQKFGLQNDTAASKLQSTTIGAKLIIPQLRIPQLNSTAEVEHQRLANERNAVLLKAIHKRREQRDSQTECEIEEKPAPLLNGFTIPKLRTATGVPLEEPKLDIPLLNQLRSQNNLLGGIAKLEQKVHTLSIASTDDGGDRNTEHHPVPTPATGKSLIDLTSTIIAVKKGEPPREAASKMRKRAADTEEKFDIPFIGCEDQRNRLSTGLLSKWQQDSICLPAIATIPEKSSVIGNMLDTIVGYPQPRQPCLTYAASAQELLNLKLYKHQDYGNNIKRFKFDTKSPDELVKDSLQKSWRLTLT
ncbi:CG17982, partial [Drosophila busckii]